MAEPVDHLREELGGHDATSQQYRSHRRQPHRPVHSAPLRDRYRSSRRSDDIDEATDQHSQEITYDDFGERGQLLGDRSMPTTHKRADHGVLLQSYDDRIRRAVRGDARLSLPPRTAQQLLHISSQPMPSFDELESPVDTFVNKSMLLQRFNQDMLECNIPMQACEDGTHSSNRWECTGVHDHNSSSDAPLEASSSPAYMAAQRRARPLHTFVQRAPEQHAIDTSHSNELPSTISAISVQAYQPKPDSLGSTSMSPTCQGIPLVAVSSLPDRFQLIFPFPAFNAVQSKCFPQVYECDDNFVLSSPTGSGKTVILELAICRVLVRNMTAQYKIVYLAPTKALCSERQRDWEKKFKVFSLTTVELTGDSDYADLCNVQRADIITTTPEKWDSMTRKWRDHEKLMRLVKLFLIDEVHILKDDRGAILEAVVSRMKTVNATVRFIALSATIPNFDDVATWLRKSHKLPMLPANSESFSDEFRPVRLKKHVCGYPSNGNDFQFEVFLNERLPEVISRYSEGKPIMIFCCTRASTISTARLLADWFTSATQSQRHWKAPSKPLAFQDLELQELAVAAVAFHHGGLDVNDRLRVEQGYLNGDINVICCTSTLAVGVNLPCHFVIVKNTVTYSNNGLQEYSDLEIMQMLGRAGRPQFDDSAVAVILTRQYKAVKYEKMVSGQELLESNLHLGFIDHLNAEIGLGTINDLTSARKWLSGTFLYVRLKKNPRHYKVNAKYSEQAIEEYMDSMCQSSLELLRQNNLIESNDRFTCTESGHAMARYYVQFKTMQVLLGLPPKAQISEILSAIAQAAEFREMRFRSGEKSLYKSLNQSLQIRFPIPVTLTLPAHKVSLIIQSVLGAADIRWDKNIAKHRYQYNQEANMVFRHANRLVRCIIDCQLDQNDAIAAGHALMVERSLCARAWDDAPVHMKQIPDIGNVSVRKLTNAGIQTIEELEFTDAQRIETILGRNPPFGLKLLDRLKLFPKLRISVHVLSNTPKKRSNGVEVTLKANFGFLNEQPPLNWTGKAIYVCMLAERSDGRKLHFARISAKKLGGGQQLEFTAILTQVGQCVNISVMCNEIAGTFRQVTVKPNVAPSMFPATESTRPPSTKRSKSNTSRRRTEIGARSLKMDGLSDEFDDGIDDEDLVNASCQDLDFDHIENYSNPTDAPTRKDTNKNASVAFSRKQLSVNSDRPDNYVPKQLESGKWDCNHTCKDKTTCKHLCCRDGLDKPPKRPTKKMPVSDTTSLIETTEQEEIDGKIQTKLPLTSSSKRKSTDQVDQLDLTATDKRKRVDTPVHRSLAYHSLQQLHNNVQRMTAQGPTSSVLKVKPAYCYATGGAHDLSFFGCKDPDDDDRAGLSYHDTTTYDVSSSLVQQLESSEQQKDDVSKTFRTPQAGEEATARVFIPQDCESEVFDDNDSIFGEVMVGLADSQDLQESAPINDDTNKAHHSNARGAVSSLSFPKTEVTEIAPATFLPSKRLSRHSRHPAPASSQSTSLMFQSGSSEDQQNATITVDSGLDKSEAGSDTPNLSTRNVIGSAVDEVSEPKKMDADEQQKTPKVYHDLEPWLFQEFGDIVELADG